MAQPTPQPERRRRPRAIADLPLSLTIGDRVHDLRMRDISELGLRCTAPLRVPARTDCEASFALPGHAEPLRLRARTVRCTAVDERGTAYTLGLQFFDVPPLARAAIFGFVKKGRRAP